MADETTPEVVLTPEAQAVADAARKHAPRATEWTSVSKRLKSLFTKAGLPVAKKSGRYLPFSSTVVITEGYRISRLGCSDSIVIHWSEAHRHGRSVIGTRESRKRHDAFARAFVIACGYTLDPKYLGICIRTKETR